jgi:hypothetical protein
MFFPEYQISLYIADRCIPQIDIYFKDLCEKVKILFHSQTQNVKNRPGITEVDRLCTTHVTLFMTCIKNRD